MSNLPVREMVLYKHGVGFFVRQGTFSGDSLTLTFRADDINDVLKSLTVLDRAGGQVLGVHYQTPMDREQRLQQSTIRLSDRRAMRDLLRDLRGRDVALEFDTLDGQGEEIAGRLLGIDEVPANNAAGQYTTTTVSLLLGNGLVQVYELDALRGILIQDALAENDLSYFLDTVKSEDTRRHVTIRLSAGEHDMVAQYVAPSPTWRVSYRLVAESDEGGEAGKALLQGWGLFDNRLEEDLDNVQVTLVAGQPISFVYELFNAPIPQRPYVQDESYTLDKLIEFEGANYATDAVEQKQPGEYIRGYKDAVRSGKVMLTAGGSLPEVPNAPAPEALKAGTATQAQGTEAGELFHYQVTAPVSVKRGESALVPIIGEDVRYQRELLYNHSKSANHPVAAFRIQNSTGFTLERGPITIVEDGDYKGEAVVAFTKKDNELYLPFAIEKGVSAKTTQQQTSRVYAITFQGDSYWLEQHQYIGTTYTLHNTTSDEKTVLVEQAKQEPFELYHTPPPDAETLTDQRWKVTVPAGERVEFVVTQRRAVRSKKQIQSLTAQNLDLYLREQWIDHETFDKLAGILRQQAEIAQLRQEMKTRGDAREGIFAEQKSYRENLGALSDRPDEAPLRQRILESFNRSQDTLEANQARVGEIEQAIRAAEATIAQMIAALNQKP